MSTTIENYCIDCKAVAQPDCEQRGHVVGTLGSTEPDIEPEPGSTAAGEWQVSRYLPSTRSDAQRIAVITAPHPDGGGQDVIECLECIAEIVTTEHNQHAALVAERDRLLRLLRPVTSPTSCYCAVMKDEKCWHCEARELLAGTEQGGETR